jgi:arylsulfatase A-like enzyme
MERLQRRAVARLHEVDLALGWLFGYLERTGLAEQSVVVLLSDHGDQFRRGQQPLLCESRTHVPLMIRAPAIPHERIAAPVSAGIDILPTVLYLVDEGEPVADIQGRLMPPFGPERESVISESIYEGVYQAAVRTRDFVLHVRGRYDSKTKKVLTGAGFERQLFVRTDEARCCDVKREHPEVASRLLQQLLEHLEGHREP